jgi:hypothetical protein
MLAPTSRMGKHMRTTCQQRRARLDPLQATCAQPGPPAHPRATIMRWASENREQRDQCASLPRIQPCLPRPPARANTCALLASNDARARIHFKQLARNLDHPRTHAPPFCGGPVRAESNKTSTQASRAPNHACPDFPHWQTHARYLPAGARAFESTSSNFARNLDHPRTHAPPVCVGPVRVVRANTCALLAGNDARARIHFKQRSRDLGHPRTHAPPLCFGSVTTESSTTSAQASRAPHHACLTPRTLRATSTTRTPTRHHYALRQ